MRIILCSTCKDYLEEHQFTKRPEYARGRDYECRWCRRVRTAAQKQTRKKKKIWRQSRPIESARWAVNNAIRIGKMIKPHGCKRCGKSTRSRLLHAHHPDYSKQLDVVWMCAQCHAVTHMLEKALL